MASLTRCRLNSLKAMFGLSLKMLEENLMFGSPRNR